MNYGKKEIDRKIKTLNSSKRKVLNKIKLNLKIIVVIVIIVVGRGTTAAAGA